MCNIVLHKVLYRILSGDIQWYFIVLLKLQRQNEETYVLHKYVQFDDDDIIKILKKVDRKGSRKFLLRLRLYWLHIVCKLINTLFEKINKIKQKYCVALIGSIGIMYGVIRHRIFSFFFYFNFLPNYTLSSNTSSFRCCHVNFLALNKIHWKILEIKCNHVHFQHWSNGENNSINFQWRIWHS